MYMWVSSAFQLKASLDDTWSVPGELRALDQSLSCCLEGLMKSSGDASFIRRLAMLERECMVIGKSIPFRKLFAMVAHRSIRDPTQEDALNEAAFVHLTAAGNTVPQMIGFLDEFLDLLGRAVRDSRRSKSLVRVEEMHECYHQA